MNDAPTPHPLDSIFEGSGLAVYALSADRHGHGVVWANDRIRTLLHGAVSRGERPGERVVPEDHPHCPLIPSASIDPRIENTHYRILTPNGLRRVSDDLLTQNIAEGLICRVVRDIGEGTAHSTNPVGTGAERPKERISEAQVRYRDLVENAHQGIFVHRDFTPLFANQAAADMFGFRSPEHMLEIPSILMLFAEHERDRARQYKDARLRGEAAPTTYECEGIRADGKAIWFEARVGFVDWEAGRAIQVACVEVTSRKLAELNMVEARAEAEHANRAKSDFLAKMSHELRTPLNAILGFSEILATHFETDDLPMRLAKGPEYMGYIGESARHLLSIVNDILDLSRIEAGEMPLDEAVFELSDALDSACDIVRGTLRDKSLKLTVSVEPEAKVHADRRAIVQILTNILSNAVKFTPSQGLIEVAVLREPGGHLEISVKDSGPGIARENIPHVLKPFGQAADQTAYTASGTGLGLPIAKSLTELHGGELRIGSAERQGACVRVWLPAERAFWPRPHYTSVGGDQTL